MRRIGIILTIIALSWWSCKQIYNPKPITSAGSYLVVEGAINTGTDSTVIRLSRTVPISSRAANMPELGAVVSIISDGGASYPCIEAGKGYYRAAGLNLTSGNFGLKINTKDGKVYQSDLVPIKNSPPIDSVYYRIGNNGVQVYADTHDPPNNTRYYRWDFNETYEYKSAFLSIDYFTNIPKDTVLSRALPDYVYRCWRSDTSSSVILNSSARLTNDIITKNPVTFVESTSEKLEAMYSILVRQYALTADAYNYFQQLKKNTEQLGNIFDPQPSVLTGNIHCITDASEVVIGYVTAGSISEQRIFIANRALPAWHAITPYDNCKLDTDLFDRLLPNGYHVKEVQLFIYNGIERPVYPIGPPGGPIIGYAVSNIECIDCTLRGTTKRPDFWIDQ